MCGLNVCLLQEKNDSWLKHIDRQYNIARTPVMRKLYAVKLLFKELSWDVLYIVTCLSTACGSQSTSHRLTHVEIL